MRLSTGNAHKLTTAIRRDRLRRWGIALAVCLAIIGAFAFITGERLQRIDRTVEVTNHAATVVQLKRPPARGVSVVTVHLSDGRDVDAVSQFQDYLAPGSPVTIAEARHASGKVSFDVTKLGQ